MPESTGGLDPNIARLASEAAARLNKPKSPNIIGRVFNSGIKDKLSQAGGWVKEKTAQAGEKAGQVKEKVTMSAKDLKEKLQDWQKSPFGKAIETALVDFVNKDLQGTIDKLNKENFKKILTDAALKIAGNTAIKWALYKTQETAGKMWEKKYDIATGALVGAGLRATFITAGAEAYIAKAVVSGLVASGRRGWAELESYDKPDTLRARANLIKRFKELPSERKRQLGKKMLYAGVAGAAGSLIGMELMEHTGLGNFLHEALASGAGKVGEIAGGIGSAISEAKDHIPELPHLDMPNQAPQVQNEPGMFNAAPIATATPIPPQELTPSPTGTPLPADNLPSSPIEVQTPTPVSKVEVPSSASPLPEQTLVDATHTEGVPQDINPAPADEPPEVDQSMHTGTDITGDNVQTADQTGHIGSGDEAQVTAPPATPENPLEKVESSIDPEEMKTIEIHQGDTWGQMMVNSGNELNWGSGGAEMMGAHIAANYDLLNNYWEAAGMHFPISPSELNTLVEQAKGGDAESLSKLKEALHWIPAGQKFRVLTGDNITSIISALK